MSEIEIIGAKQSIFVRVAWIVCEEKRVPYRVTPAWPGSPEVLALNPFGKIPAMRHGALTLFESKAIATYLDRAFEGPKLVPDDPVDGARVEQWVSAVNANVVPTWMSYFHAHVFPKTADAGPDRDVIEALVPQIAGQVAILAEALGRGPYLAGDRFSLADIALAPSLHYLHQFPEALDRAAGAAGLRDYFERLSLRPSLAATVPPPMP